MAIPKHYKQGIKCLYDPGAGEGEIQFLGKFAAESPLFKADCLKDWLWDLTKEYEKERDLAFPKRTKVPTV